jgi:hypothetical protein
MAAFSDWGARRSRRHKLQKSKGAPWHNEEFAKEVLQRSMAEMEKTNRKVLVSSSSIDDGVLCNIDRGQQNSGRIMRGMK